MKKTNFLIVLIILLSACGPSMKESGAISTCRLTMDAMSALMSGLDFPANFQTENPVKAGGEFDVMQYFKVLDHLSMQPGYILDYVYHQDGMGGYPILYAHPTDQSPYATEADLPANHASNDYLGSIQVEDTPEGYFQYVVLAIMGNNFYLDWHANYFDSQIVCERADVRRIVSSLNGDFGYRISLPSWVKAFLLKETAPSVVINPETVEVNLVTFTLWGGFYLQTYTLNRSLPHTIQDVQEKNLVPYDCGVMF
jgi:hypothetical protein